MKDKLMERPLLNGIVRQRVDNGMLCLSDLTEVNDDICALKGFKIRRVRDFFMNESEREYITELLELDGVFMKAEKSAFTEQAKNKGLISALKSIGKYSTKGRGDNKSTYCDMYIFVAIAQWLNPMLRAYVTKWVTDSLILNRIEAGNNFNMLCSTISDKIIPTLESENAKKFIYSNFTKLINKKVFGRHDNDLRQIASKEQLSNLNKWETKLTTLIEVGYISNYQEAKEYIENN